MSKVWVPHPVKEDLSAARVFGELVFVNDRYIYADEIDDEGAPPPFFVSHIRDAVSQFDHQNDYLLIVGDHLQLIMFASELGGDYRVLRYDRQAEGYVPVWIAG